MKWVIFLLLLCSVSFTLMQNCTIWQVRMFVIYAVRYINPAHTESEMSGTMTEDLCKHWNRLLFQLEIEELTIGSVVHTVCAYLDFNYNIIKRFDRYITACGSVLSLMKWVTFLLSSNNLHSCMLCFKIQGRTRLQVRVCATHFVTYCNPLQTVSNFPINWYWN